ncbi:MAG: outer membrane lipoprotein-sorting protein [Gammaproteobacteria bacterium]|nr:outer membrane lipoprotein-sorting protein [Gammaproteobacteria bacterium]
MLFAAIALLGASGTSVASENPDANQILRSAIDNWRGITSVSEMTMTINRPTWQRAMSLKAWTQGDKFSLVRLTAPVKDAGASTLINDKQMWSYAPKINRIIKIPASMMGQSWMGSDFSNKDIGRSTEILEQYNHTLLRSVQSEGHQVHTIVSIPHEDSPVVWGKEVLMIRDDYVILEHQYWDQDGVLVKRLKTMEVSEMGGRIIARRVRMSKLEEPEHWTEVLHHYVEFDVALPPHTFTLSNLRNPR